ncbi:MAG TPA: IS21-like element helper ATPase IstB [Candidatus Acidoferrum sp.]|nr:IS21-like element helper ATPase IstB [Candidatus Acidoferrum sp.]
MTADRPPAIDLDGLLRRLHLPTVRRLYPDLAERAETEDMTYRDFLAVLMAEETAHRAQTRIQRCVRRAHFPFLKTIDEYDFTFQSAIRLSLLGSALGPEFITQGHSLVVSGPSGTGKTHLAVAIAYRAIQNGVDAYFTTATALIDELSVGSRRGKLRHVLPTYTHPAVLVIDEVGYLSYGPDAANVLFQVVNDRYLHQRPMIFTTNKPLAAWGRVLHDPDLAEAILDRVLERGRHLELRGRSYRTRHTPLDLNPAPESPSPRPSRISGNHPAEFPEPTWPNARNMGERATCNAAFSRLVAEGVGLHADDLAKSHWLESLYAMTLDQNPNLTSLCGSWDDWHGDATWCLARITRSARLISWRARLRRRAALCVVAAGGISPDQPCNCLGSPRRGV